MEFRIFCWDNKKTWRLDFIEKSGFLNYKLSFTVIFLRACIIQCAVLYRKNPVKTGFLTYTKNDNFEFFTKLESRAEADIESAAHGAIVYAAHAEIGAPRINATELRRRPVVATQPERTIVSSTSSCYS